MQIVTISQIRHLEQQMMKDGISGFELMRRAGEGAAAEILHYVECRYPLRSRQRYVLFAGKGNNGGDAWVVARKLFEFGCAVELYSICSQDQLQGDALEHALELPPEIPQFTCWDGKLPDTALREGSIVVDGLLGTGFHGELRSDIAAIVKKINDVNLPVIALDIPSGVNGDSGKGEKAVVADCTLTMGLPKIGLFSEDGLRCSGIIRIIDIGLFKEWNKNPQTETIDTFGTYEAKKLLKRREAVSHKNSFGHALCLSGSQKYYGAAYLGAEACVLSGAGLVTLAMPATCLPHSASLSLIIQKLGDEWDPFFKKEMIPEIEKLLPYKTALLYGPGVDVNADPEVLEFLLKQQNLPLVIDADGLRIFAAHPALHHLRKDSKNLILTPHPGELKALGKGFDFWILMEQDHPMPQIADAISAAAGAVVVLKGHQTRVYDNSGGYTINLSGSPALATAGTGDVLAGVITALLAQGMPPADAARLGVFLHGHAADLACCPQRCFTADKLLEMLPIAFQDICPVA